MPASTVIGAESIPEFEKPELNQQFTEAPNLLSAEQSEASTTGGCQWGLTIVCHLTAIIASRALILATSVCWRLRFATSDPAFPPLRAIRWVQLINRPNRDSYLMSLSSLIWSVAELLRGDYKQSDYGKVILPFTVLRRLDCVLEPTKKAVLAENEARTKAKVNPEPFLLRKSGVSFYNTSPMDLKALMGDQDHIQANLLAYIQGFSPAARDIFERFDFYTQVDRLAKCGLLYAVTEKFAAFDLHPDVVSNAEMGLVFEELIRRFAELSNETAGEHFTPREVIRLMVNLLFVEDDEILSKPGVVRTIYDPTAGTGGMLSIAGEHLAELNPDARLTMFGQELNDESYAICKADMLIKGQDVKNIIAGNTLSDDGHRHKKFDYMLSNPPFGVDWKKVERQVRREHESEGFNGRFGPGLPRVSDGSLLFLLHLISKMRPAVDGGSRFGIVLNGSGHCFPGSGQRRRRDPSIRAGGKRSAGSDHRAAHGHVL